MAYARLRRHLSLAERPIRVYDLIQQLAVIDDDVLDLLQVDTIELGRAFAGERHVGRIRCCRMGRPARFRFGRIRSWPMVVGTCRRQMAGRWGHRCTIYFEQTYHPFGDTDDLDHIPEAMEIAMWTAVKTPPGPLAAGPDGAVRLREGARQLRAETDRAILGLFGGNLLEMGQGCTGWNRSSCCWRVNPHGRMRSWIG